MNDHRTKMILKAAKKRAGDGWKLLGPELQEALICREIVFMLLGSMSDEDEAKKPFIREALTQAEQG